MATLATTSLRALVADYRAADHTARTSEKFAERNAAVAKRSLIRRGLAEDDRLAGLGVLLLAETQGRARVAELLEYTPADQAPDSLPEALQRLATALRGVDEYLVD